MIIDNEKVLTRKEAANYIGINVRTLDLWVKKGSISPIKINGRVFFSLISIYNMHNIPLPDKYKV